MCDGLAQGITFLGLFFLVTSFRQGLPEEPEALEICEDCRLHSPKAQGDQMSRGVQINEVMHSGSGHAILFWQEDDVQIVQAKPTSNALWAVWAWLTLKKTLLVTSCYLYACALDPVFYSMIVGTWEIFYTIPAW